jgi:ABC-type lipoprotein export system ATPase subunit
MQVSGGEAQRTAVARAVIKDPSLIVADEPVSSLDEASARSVCDLLNEFAGMPGKALLITSTAADKEVTNTLRVNRRYVMNEGQLSKA